MIWDGANSIIVHRGLENERTTDRELNGGCAKLENAHSLVDPKSRFLTPNFHSKSQVRYSKAFFGTKFAFKKSKCNVQIKCSPLLHCYPQAFTDVRLLAQALPVS
jgi:hypothetical protein